VTRDPRAWPVPDSPWLERDRHRAARALRVQVLALVVCALFSWLDSQGRLPPVGAPSGLLLGLALIGSLAAGVLGPLIVFALAARHRYAGRWPRACLASLMLVAAQVFVLLPSVL
jgi:hypothetical protein